MDVLRAEHRALVGQVRHLSEQLDTDSHVEPALVNGLVHDLSIHDVEERAILYPLVASRIGRQPTLHGIETHGAQARVLAEIERRGVDDPHRPALLRSLVEAVDNHIRDEENIIFPALSDLMAPEERLHEGARVLDVRRRAPTRPHPHLPGSGSGTLLAARMLGPADHLRDRLQGRHRDPDALPTPTGPPRPRGVDILEAASADHARLLGLLGQLTADSPVNQQDETARRFVVDVFASAASRHETAEELVLWPATRKRVSNGRALADQALEQERECRYYVDALLAAHADHSRKQLAAELATVLREHVRFEERVVWPALRRATSKVNRISLGVKYGLALRIGPTRPHTRGPDTPFALKTVGAATAAIDRARDKVTGRQT